MVSAKDGTTLLPPEIKGFNVYLNSIHVSTLSPDATGFVLTLDSGDYIVGITCVDMDDRESTIATTAVGILSPPKPVMGLSVSISR
jgi:hypothetical protein